MTKMLIKICGIREPEIATQAVRAGAHFIGLIFHPPSPRHISVEQAAAVSTAVRKAGAQPVAVFVDQNEIEMQEICKATHIQVVQLHGPLSRARHHLLPSHYQRVYVLPVSEQGELETDSQQLGFRLGANARVCNNAENLSAKSIDEVLQYLDPGRDLVLIDHIEPGQGLPINRSKFCYSLPFRWMLAGGLSPSNVGSAIHELQPNGVDVSSGVESAKGKKDISLIQAFITSVRGDHVT